jgi:hypothetical protein
LASSGTKQFFRTGLRSQSYNFGIYNYNASVVIGYIHRALFETKENIFVSKTHYATGSVVIFTALALEIAVVGLAPVFTTRVVPKG